MVVTKATPTPMFARIGLPWAISALPSSLRATIPNAPNARIRDRRSSRGTPRRRSSRTESERRPRARLRAAPLRAGPRGRRQAARAPASVAEARTGRTLDHPQRGREVEERLRPGDRHAVEPEAPAARRSRRRATGQTIVPHGHHPTDVRARAEGQHAACQVPVGAWKTRQASVRVPGEGRRGDDLSSDPDDDGGADGE